MAQATGRFQPAAALDLLQQGKNLNVANLESACGSARARQCRLEAIASWTWWPRQCATLQARHILLRDRTKRIGRGNAGGDLFELARGGEVLSLRSSFLASSHFCRASTCVTIG
jgi:hypothetical protein